MRASIRILKIHGVNTQRDFNISEHIFSRESDLRLPRKKRLFKYHSSFWRDIFEYHRIDGACIRGCPCRGATSISPKKEDCSLSALGAKWERMVCHRDKFTTSNPRSYEKYFYRLGRSRIGQGHGRSEREEEKRRKKRWATVARRGATGLQPGEGCNPRRKIETHRVRDTSRLPTAGSANWFLAFRYMAKRHVWRVGSGGGGWRMVGR